MKKTFLLLGFLLTLCGYGQIKKGSFVIEGSSDMNIGVISENGWSGDSKMKINFSPSFGYFIINNLSLSVKAKFSTDIIQSLGPTVRYYYPLKYFSPFLQLESSYGKVKVDTYYWDKKRTANFNKYAAAIGISKKIGNITHFEIMTGYANNNMSIPQYEREIEIISHGLSVNFGLIFILNKNEDKNNK